MSNEISIVAPRSIEESEKLSQTLSKSSLLPEALRGKPGDILATLLSGAELGLAPMQSLRGIVIIKGKPSLSADLMGALVKRRRDISEYLLLVESTTTKATYRTRRVGEPEPTTMSFTLDDAKAAGIAGDMYRKYPAQMLRARCLAAICRAVYPDLCMGLYDSDSGELTDGVPLTAFPPPIERELNPPPPAATPAPALAEPKQSRTAALKEKVKAKIQFVDVQPGETLEQADARTKVEEAKKPPPEPTVYERITIMADEYGLEPTKVGSVIRGATGKQKKEQLTEDDVGKVRDSLEQFAKAKAVLDASNQHQATAFE